MPTHRFTCPTCGKALQVDDALLARIQAEQGGVTRCPSCQNSLSLSGFSSSAPPLPIVQARPEEPRERPRRQRPADYDDDYEDDRPRSRSGSRSRSRSDIRNETRVEVRVGGSFPHLLHFILTLCTGGLWLPVWILHRLFSSR